MVRGKGRIRLLLIEGEGSTAGSIGRTLGAAARRELTVTAADCAAVGLEILQREEFSVVLLDLNLTCGSDAETLQEILTQYPTIPLIVLAAADGKAAALDAVKRGAHDYLIKEELSPGLIVHSIRHAIQRMNDRQEIARLHAELETRVEERTARFGLIHQELTERNEFNFALFEHNPIETIVVNLEGRIVNFNRAKRLSQGRIPEIGMLMYRDFAGGHDNDMRAELMRAMDRGAVKHFPEQWYGDRCLAITISPFSRGAIITSQDITAQKTAQEALRESEEKYRLVVENAIDGIVIVQNGRFSYLNPAACTIIGHPSGALFGRQFSEFVAPDDRKEVVREYRRKLSGDERTYPTPFRFIASDGSFRWVEAIAAPVSWEGEPALLSFMRDISEQKSAQDALRQSERKYRELVETLDEGIWVIDRGGSTTYANPRMADMLGYGVDDVMGRHLFSFMVKAAVPHARQSIERWKRGIRESSEFEFLKKDGTSPVRQARRVAVV